LTQSPGHPGALCYLRPPFSGSFLPLFNSHLRPPAIVAPLLPQISCLFVPVSALPAAGPATDRLHERKLRRKLASASAAKSFRSPHTRPKQAELLRLLHRRGSFARVFEALILASCSTTTPVPDSLPPPPPSPPALCSRRGSRRSNRHCGRVRARGRSIRLQGQGAGTHVQTGMERS